ELVDGGAEALLARHLGLVVGTDEKAGRRAPDVAASVDRRVAPFVQVARSNERDAMAIDQVEQPRTRTRLHRPIAGIAFGARFDEERTMREPRETPPARVCHRGVEPVELLCLFGASVAAQHRVEADQTPLIDV